MAHQRYDLRKELDGTWTVFDVFTGWAAEVNGRPAKQLDAQDADELVDLLNYQDAKRRGTLRQR